MKIPLPTQLRRLIQKLNIVELRSWNKQYKIERSVFTKKSKYHTNLYYLGNKIYDTSLEINLEVI